MNVHVTESTYARNLRHCRRNDTPATASTAGSDALLGPFCRHRSICLWPEVPGGGV